jgi:hypothetical protein
MLEWLAYGAPITDSVCRIAGRNWPCRIAKSDAGWVDADGCWGVQDPMPSHKLFQRLINAFPRSVIPMK